MYSSVVVTFFNPQFIGMVSHLREPKTKKSKQTKKQKKMGMLQLIVVQKSTDSFKGITLGNSI